MNLRIMEAPSTEFFARMLSVASASEIPMTSFKTAAFEKSMIRRPVYDIQRLLSR
jgi:hypothetical protein